MNVRERGFNIHSKFLSLLDILREHGAPNANRELEDLLATPVPERVPPSMSASFQRTAATSTKIEENTAANGRDSAPSSPEDPIFPQIAQTILLFQLRMFLSYFRNLFFSTMTKEMYQSFFRIPDSLPDLGFLLEQVDVLFKTVFNDDTPIEYPETIEYVVRGARNYFEEEEGPSGTGASSPSVEEVGSPSPSPEGVEGFEDVSHRTQSRRDLKFRQKFLLGLLDGFHLQEVYQMESGKVVGVRLNAVRTAEEQEGRQHFKGTIASSSLDGDGGGEGVKIPEFLLQAGDKFPEFVQIAGVSLRGRADVGSTGIGKKDHCSSGSCGDREDPDHQRFPDLDPDSFTPPYAVITALNGLPITSVSGFRHRVQELLLEESPSDVVVEVERVVKMTKTRFPQSLRDFATGVPNGGRSPFAKCLETPLKGGNNVKLFQLSVKNILERLLENIHRRESFEDSGPAEAFNKFEKLKKFYAPTDLSDIDFSINLDRTRWDCRCFRSPTVHRAVMEQIQRVFFRELRKWTSEEEEGESEDGVAGRQELWRFIARVRSWVESNEANVVSKLNEQADKVRAEVGRDGADVVDRRGYMMYCTGISSC